MKNWISFESKGIETDSDLAKKLWRVSRILNKTPFENAVLELNTAQINFILRMYSADHPDEFKILDPKIAEGKGPTQVWNNWSAVFYGDTKKEFDRNPVLFLKKYYNISAT
jgi:hypothetical protein